MTLSELEHFRNLLLERENNLKELAGDAVVADGEDTSRVHNLLLQIRDALGRVEDNSFGTCRVCQGEIELHRLEVQPAVEVCLGCISDKEKELLEEELFLASKIHRALLPQSVAKIEGYEVSVKSLSARFVGGDYYDFLTERDHNPARVVIADVMGKGLPAGMLMSNIQGATRILAEEIFSPGQLITRLNGWLCRNVPVTKFVTMVCLAVVKSKDGIGELSLTNAGHWPPLVIRRDGKVEEFAATGTVLGIDESFTFGECGLKLAPGELLALYTDGVTEAESLSGEMFGYDRLREFLCSHKDDSLGTAQIRLLEAVHSFCGRHELSDDYTVILLRKI